MGVPHDRRPPPSHPPSCLALGLAGALLAACQSQEAKLAEHQERAEAYLEEGKNAEAIIEYKNVLQIDPNDAAAHYGLAKAYLARTSCRRATGSCARRRVSIRRISRRSSSMGSWRASPASSTNR